MQDVKFSEGWQDHSWTRELVEKAVENFNGQDKTELYARLKAALAKRDKEKRISMGVIRHSNMFIARYREMLTFKKAVQTILPRVHPDRIIISPRSCFEVSNSYLNAGNQINIYKNRLYESIVCFMPNNMKTAVIFRKVHNRCLFFIEDPELDSGYHVSDLHEQGIMQNENIKDIGELMKYEQIAKEDYIKFMQEVRNVQASLVST